MDHTMDGLALEEQQRQMQHTHRSIVQQTQHINQGMAQQMDQNQAQSQMEKSADMQTQQKDTPILSQIKAIPADCCRTEQNLDREVEAAGKLGRRAVEERQRDSRSKIREDREEYQRFFEREQNDVPAYPQSTDHHSAPSAG